VARERAPGVVLERDLPALPGSFAQFDRCLEQGELVDPGREAAIAAEIVETLEHAYERIVGRLVGDVFEVVAAQMRKRRAPTGDLEARRFILEHYSQPRICTVEDIVFFNGLGEAINKIFSNLPSTARVIGPNPTYPSHATAEAMHHGGHHLTYALKLDDGGRIDLEDLSRTVREHEHIVGILVINPNNPLGVVHPREDLEAVVRIAGLSAGPVRVRTCTLRLRKSRADR